MIVLMVILILVIQALVLAIKIIFQYTWLVAFYAKSEHIDSVFIDLQSKIPKLLYSVDGAYLPDVKTIYHCIIKSCISF